MEKSYFQTEPKIRRLVACMNTCGLKTYASCQIVRRLLPYVAFIAPLHQARRLARLVREDAESLSPALYWGWEVVPVFNDQFLLCRRLVPVSPHHHWYRYWRKTLDNNFQQLCLLIKYSGQ
ncbi:TPA: hypothetical protein ACJG9G_005317 [Salmonella enterica subsp. enterica serovar Java]